MMMSVADPDSYPPLFRPRRTTPVADDDLTLADSDKLSQMNNKVQDSDDPLPVIDFKCISDTSELDEACRDWGMFRLINHGIPTTLLEQLHQQARQLFSLPYESKQASFKTPISYFWGTPGLTPTGVAIQFQNLNWIEGFHVLLNPLPQLQYEDPVLDSFRSVLYEYGRHQTRVATTIFEAMAINLQLDSRRAKSYISPGTGHLRVHRYPRCFDADDDDQQQLQPPWGIDVHTDSAILSILHQDDVGGLQVFNNHQWFDVKPRFDSLIVNLGDMMQAMSNDVYMAAKHRVKLSKRKERISVGYFVLPYDDTVIESSKYRPFTYANFRAEVQQDLKTVGHKIGLPKFRLDDTF